MAQRRDNDPIRVRLAEDRKEAILRALKDFHVEKFDEDISDFKAEQILAFFLKALGPPVYNQAVQDARGFMLEKLEDLDGEIYEKEGPV